MPRFYRQYNHPILLLIDLLITMVIHIVCLLIKAAFWLAGKVLYGVFWILSFLFNFFLRSPYMKRQYSAVGRKLRDWTGRETAAASHRWRDYQSSRKRKKQRWFADAACTVECEEPMF